MTIKTYREIEDPNDATRMFQQEYRPLTNTRALVAALRAQGPQRCREIWDIAIAHMDSTEQEQIEYADSLWENGDGRMPGMRPSDRFIFQVWCAIHDIENRVGYDKLRGYGVCSWQTFAKI